MSNNRQQNIWIISIFVVPLQLIMGKTLSEAPCETFEGKTKISVCCLFNNVRETWRWKEQEYRVTVDAHVMWALLHLYS